MQRSWNSMVQKVMKDKNLKQSGNRILETKTVKGMKEVESNASTQEKIMFLHT